MPSPADNPFDPETNIRLSTLHMLCALGWRYLPPGECAALRGGKAGCTPGAGPDSPSTPPSPPPSGTLLRASLAKALEARTFIWAADPQPQDPPRRYPLSPPAIAMLTDHVASMLQRVGRDANQNFHSILTKGGPTTERMPNKSPHRIEVALIDWERPEANLFEVAERMPMAPEPGGPELHPDLVCFVNGIPLALIETVQPQPGQDGAEAVLEGIARHTRRQAPDGIPSLYTGAALLFALGPDGGRYGTDKTPPLLWAQWRDEELCGDRLEEIKNKPLSGHNQAALLESLPPGQRSTAVRRWGERMVPNGRDGLLAGLLTPARLLEFVRGFILFDRHRGKMAARHQQFFGVRKMLAQADTIEPDDRSRRGGVLWHSAGSGKSHTMVLLARALLVHPRLRRCRVLVVSDRLDIQRHLTEVFAASGGLRDGAKLPSGKSLARWIGCGEGDGPVRLATVQKFLTACRLDACFQPNSDMVVLVDESHRSHSGELHKAMKKMLPRAAYLGFTGTPLLKQEKIPHPFGKVLHTYTMLDAVRDGAVVPLLYEERLAAPMLENAAQADLWFEQATARLPEAARDALLRGFGQRGALHSADGRLRAVAWDIAQHFSKHVKPLGLGLKGQLAADSKLDAVRYKKHLDATGLVSSVVIMSPPEVPEGGTAADCDSMQELQQWWRQEVGPHQASYEAAALDSFAEADGADLLIVVDRLLTGFDQASNSVLYIDKPLRGHGLLQAIARVNRLHGGKRHGMLIDYRSNLKPLERALRDYQHLERELRGQVTVDGFDPWDLQGMCSEAAAGCASLPALNAALWAMFGPEGGPRPSLEQCRRKLMQWDAAGRNTAAGNGQAMRGDFRRAVDRFGLCLQTALSSQSFLASPEGAPDVVLRYQEDLTFFSGLRAAMSRDAPEQRPDGGHGLLTRGMLDQLALRFEIRHPATSYLLHPSNLDEPPAKWDVERLHNEACAAQDRIERTINIDLLTDPYARQAFSAQLDASAARDEALFQQPLQRYSLLKAFEDKLQRRELDGMPPELARIGNARSCFGVLRMELGEQAVARDRKRWCALALELGQLMDDTLGYGYISPSEVTRVIAYFGPT